MPTVAGLSERHLSCKSCPVTEGVPQCMPLMVNDVSFGDLERENNRQKNSGIRTQNNPQKKILRPASVLGSNPSWSQNFFCGSFSLSETYIQHLPT